MMVRDENALIAVSEPDITSSVQKKDRDDIKGETCPFCDERIVPDIEVCPYCKRVVPRDVLPVSCENCDTEQGNDYCTDCARRPTLRDKHRRKA